MRRERAYLVIVRTRVDETLAMARIVRARLRRRVAERTLARDRQWALLRRAALERHPQLARMLARVGLGGDL